MHLNKYVIEQKKDVFGDFFLSINKSQNKQRGRSSISESVFSSFHFCSCCRSLISMTSHFCPWDSFGLEILSFLFLYQGHRVILIKWTLTNKFILIYNDTLYWSMDHSLWWSLSLSLSHTHTHTHTHYLPSLILLSFSFMSLDSNWKYWKVHLNIFQT